MRFVKLVLASLVLVPALHAQADGELTRSELKSIGAATETFADAVRVGDWRAAAALYLDDATLFPPGEPVRRGRAAIASCLAGLPSMVEFTVGDTRVEGARDIAYVTGAYEVTIGVSDEAPLAVQRWNFVQVLRRQADGRWGIAVHMFHSS